MNTKQKTVNNDNDKTPKRGCTQQKERTIKISKCGKKKNRFIIVTLWCINNDDHLKLTLIF
jgi:hypothetical protein